VVLDDELVVAPVLAALDVVEVVVLLTAATGGLLEPPPHPATRTPLTSAAASRRARRERGGDVRRALSRIWSPSRLVDLRTGFTRRAVTGTFRSWRPSDRAARAAEH
jgi:hypothetical protein